ncbi:toll/interleukin-1 receptor domain-containing protein [Phenylobacterium sp.]|uniref:toll/interleukin-1 receptor domain-containing protein n=1 Tax=Phenylobacterium sp. TaxID=1871053 RepID=UPI0035689A34
MSASIFISFASQDHRVAMTLCQALESRGFKCWISGRDIQPGENFQVAIVRAIRQAKIMLLVFTANSNNSEEMNKELALASQSKLIVVPLRIEDVTPNDAFAYEFATRQWIDFFADWEFAIEQLAQRIGSATRDMAPEPPLVEASPPQPLPAPAPAVEAADGEGPALALARRFKLPRRPPRVGASEAETAPAEESRTFEAAETLAAADADDAIETPEAAVIAGARPRRTALYVGLSIAALAVVAIGLATPSLMRSKSAAAQPRAMTALLPSAPPSALQKVSTDAAAAPAPAVDPAAAAAADPAPVKVARKKKPKAVEAADDVPY